MATTTLSAHRGERTRGLAPRAKRPALAPRPRTPREGVARAREARREGGLVVAVEGAGLPATLCYPSCEALGRRAAALFKARTEGSPAGAAERAAVDVLVELASRGDGRDALRDLSLGGAHVPGMIQSALLVGDGPVPLNQVADLCGLCAFVLSLDPVAYGIDDRELESWRALGSASALALAGLRPLTLSATPGRAN